MLGSVGAAEHDNRDTQLDVANCLAEQVQKVAEIADAAHEGRHTADGHVARELVCKQQIVQVALHVVGFD
jgi:hypothetical protein